MSHEKLIYFNETLVKVENKFWGHITFLLIIAPPHLLLAATLH